jgi:hypothetical protein
MRPTIEQWKAEALQARIEKERAECPYYELLGPIWDQHEKFCWYSMEPCGAGKHCPAGKW